MIDHHGYPFIRSLLQAKRIRKHERAKKKTNLMEISRLLYSCRTRSRVSPTRCLVNFDSLFHWALLGSTDFHPVLQSVRGVIPDLTRFRQVQAGLDRFKHFKSSLLLGFTGFLLTFTKSYWIFKGLYRILQGLSRIRQVQAGLGWFKHFYQDFDWI